MTHLRGPVKEDYFVIILGNFLQFSMNSAAARILGQRGARALSAHSYKNEGTMCHVIC